MIKKFFSTSLVLAIFLLLVANPAFAKGGSGSGGEPEPGHGGAGELKHHGVSEHLGEKGRPVVTLPAVAPAISTSTPLKQEKLNASMTKLKGQVAKLNDQLGVMKADADSLNKQVADLSTQLGIAQPKKDEH